MQAKSFFSPSTAKTQTSRRHRQLTSVGLVCALAILMIDIIRQSTANGASMPRPQHVIHPEPDKDRNGLSPSDWAGIKEAYDRHRADASPRQGGSLTLNDDQQLTIDLIAQVAYLKASNVSVDWLGMA